MNAEEIRKKIKEIISNVTGIPASEIDDGASYREDLDLDSLSLLEIGVDVDYEFKLGLPEEDLQTLQTIPETVQLVLQHKVPAVPA
ncbi:MAG: acyl carrier protein [Acidobacteria bacterium]|nr:acyl carrier protein [Acidobacteriota bacterium]